jgi:hypothetical protein
MSGRAIKFGSPVQTSDGPAGIVGGVAIDAGGRRIVHLIVEPKHRHPQAHLVPVDVVASDDGNDEGLTLGCTLAELRSDMPVVESALRPARNPQPFEGGADWSEVFHAGAQPAPGFVSDPEDPGPTGPSRREVDEDVLPGGEVELRHGALVAANDYQPVGEVGGFDVDSDWNITAVKLAPRHLHRDRHVAIPIADVAVIEPDMVRLELSVERVRAL